jgi:Flp pilus assembly protein TadG
MPTSNDRELHLSGRDGPGCPKQRKNLFRLAAQFGRDTSGVYAIITALALPVLVGAAAFGTEEGLLFYKHRQMQHAADSSAFTAAAAYLAGETNIVTHADAVAASYGFVAGSNATVTVNQPPQSGPNVNDTQAIEVIISQGQPRLFSSLWGAAPIAVTARSVSKAQDQACVLALDHSASGAVSAQGSVNINLVKCAIYDDSNNAQAMSVGGAAKVSSQFVGVVGGIAGSQGITTVDGTVTGYHVVTDPYADVIPPPFSGCDQTNYATKDIVTISPGVYCGGMSLGAGAIVTLLPGTYYLDRGSLTMNGSASLTGAGVTLVFTSSTGSNYASANLGGGAAISLTAPTSGPMSGIAIYGDHNMPVGTQFDFRGGNNQAVGGAIDLPNAAVTWVGNSSTQQPCTQLIADTIQFVGDSGLAVNCGGYGTKPIALSASLLE